MHGAETGHHSGAILVFSGFALLDLLFSVWWVVYPCLSFYPFSVGHCFILPMVSSNISY